MRRAGLSGVFQCDDLSFRPRCRAAIQIDWRASDCGHADLDDLYCERARRTARSAKYRNGCDPFLALLAALVSASVFSLLLRGTGVPGASGQSEMAGRKIDRVRSRAVWRASGGLAGAIRHSVAQ